jgi:hypothetical protein
LLVLVVLMMSLTLVTPRAAAIIGGQLDGAAHPGVGFMIGYDENGVSFYGCSGTLVSATVFVTAAHCTGGEEGLVPATVRVTFENPVPLNADGIPEPTTTIEGTPHPNPAFHEDGDGFVTFVQMSIDYGVVVLQEPATSVFPNVTTYSLPAKGFLERKLNKDQFTLVGFGLSAPAHLKKSLTFDGNRRFAIVETKALKSPSLIEMISNANGVDTSDGTVCSGDSGGATLDGPVLVGVISGTDFCHHKTYSARLDVQTAIDFLSQFTR